MFVGFTVAGASLPLLNVGEQGIIARLTGQDEGINQRLKALGLDRGAAIEIVKKFPNTIVKAGTKQIALSERLSRAIYVRTFSSSNLKIAK